MSRSPAGLSHGGPAQRPRVLAGLALALAGAAAVAIAVASRSSGPPPAIAAGCGRSVSGAGFRAFSCMSGGAAGHLHPKEVLVVRTDGSSVAYPVFRTAELAAAHGEVVATYDLELVRLTTRRVVPLLTTGRLARALHVRPGGIWDLHDPTVDTHGAISFTPSIHVPGTVGCRNPRLELTGTTLRELHGSTSRTCS